MDSRNANHPKKGTSIKVQPIRSRHDIQAIKALLNNQPRNLAIFTLGINTAFRACELLSLTIGDVAHLKEGDLLEIKQSKNQQYRAATVNGVTVAALHHWLCSHPKRHDETAPLFLTPSPTPTKLSLPTGTIVIRNKQKYH